MNEPKLIVGFGGGNLAQISRSEAMTWEEFARLLTTPPPETTDKAARGWFIPADFEDDYRDSDNFKHRYALTLDYDHITRADLDTIKKTYAQYAHVLYTTWSHSGDQPRIRVVMPLSRPAQIDEFCAVSRKVAAMAGIELASRESHVPAQMMFLPTVKPGAKFSQRTNYTGQWVDVDAVLATYESWTDRASWPHRLDGDGTHKGDVQTPPAEKPGVVGDFCRVFDVPAAIAEFKLPYTYVRDEGDGVSRWTYTKGSRPEGAIVYDHGQKLHSHHDTDPARGQTNSFDLVRLHRFAELDKEVPAGTSITERPSYRAMCRTALAIPRVMAAHSAQLAEAEINDLGPLPPIEVLKDPKATQQEKKEAFEQLKPDEILRFKVHHPHEFAKGRKTEWLIKGVVAKRSISVMYGPSGAAKSFMALDMGAAVQLGNNWRGHKVTQGRVVSVVAEGQGGHGQRLEAYSIGHNVPLEKLPKVIEEPPNLIESQDVTDIALAVKAAGGADLLVIDTLAASFIGDENAGKDMQVVLRNCQKLRDLLGCAVLLIHHSGKDVDKGARGWSGLKGNVDHEFFVSRHDSDPELRVLKVTKQKDAKDGQEYFFRLKFIFIRQDEDGDKVESCICEEASKPEAQATSAGGPKLTGYEVPVMQVMRSKTRLTKEQVIAECRSRGLVEGLEPKHVSTKLGRVLDNLVTKGVLYFLNGMYSKMRSVSGDEFDEDEAE